MHSSICEEISRIGVLFFGGLFFNVDECLYVKSYRIKLYDICKHVFLGANCIKIYFMFFGVILYLQLKIIPLITICNLLKC
jgi:hypothetical protein